VPLAVVLAQEHGSGFEAPVSSARTGSSFRGIGCAEKIMNRIAVLNDASLPMLDQIGNLRLEIWSVGVGSWVLPLLRKTEKVCLFALG
jgi:hypothetical protein